MEESEKWEQAKKLEEWAELEGSEEFITVRVREVEGAEGFEGVGRVGGVGAV